MGKGRSRKRAPRYWQIDMRDWLLWLHEARELALLAGAEYRRVRTITTEALTWHALQDRMLAAGLHELRDEPIFRAAKTLYLQVESEMRCGASHDGQDKNSHHSGIHNISDIQPLYNGRQESDR